MATLRYDFSIVGTKNIDRAFASIERRAVRHNIKMSREFGGTGRRSTNLRASGAAAATATRRRLSAEVAAERKATREKVRLDKWRQDMRNRHFQQNERMRRKEAAATQRASTRALAERKRAAGNIFGRAGRSAGGALRSTGTIVGGSLALGGGFMAANAVGQQMRETAMASKLANQAGDPSMKRRLLRDSQNVRGFTGEEAMGGVGAFVDLTGDLETGRRLMKDLAQLSLATGSNLEDVAGAAGNFANNLKGIKDPGKRAAAIMEAMRAVAGQGLAGAVELKDLASGGATLGAAAGMMGGDALNNIKSAGVLAQAARAEGGADSADMATRATARFMDFAAKNAGRLEKELGIKMTNRDASGGVSSVSSPREMIADYLQATNGDLSRVTKDFGEMGGRVVRGFAGSFRTGGRDGVLKRFDELMETELGQGDISQRANSRLSDPDLQFKEVLKDFNAQVGSELLPVLTKIIPELAKLLPHVKTAAELFSKLVDAFVDNPLLTIGEMIAAKVAFDIATAKIGETIKDTLTDVVTGSGSSGASSMGASLGQAGAIPVIRTAVLSAAAGVALGIAISDAIVSAQVKNQETARNEDLERYGKALTVRNKAPANITDADRALLQESKRDLAGRIAVAEGRADSPTATAVTDILRQTMGIGAEGIAEMQNDTAILGELKAELKAITAKDNAAFEARMAEFEKSKQAADSMQRTAELQQESVQVFADAVASVGPGGRPAQGSI